jgi:hypothetical protein
VPVFYYIMQSLSSWRKPKNPTPPAEGHASEHGAEHAPHAG